MFEIELSEPCQMEAILEQAREVLTLRNLRMLQHLSGEQKNTMDDAQETEKKAFSDGLTGLYSLNILARNPCRAYANGCGYGIVAGIQLIDV